jgi:integrase
VPTTKRRPLKVAVPETRERGQVIPRGPGKWLVRVSLPKNASGKRTTSSETVHGTRRDAEKVLTRKLAEVDAGTFVPPARQTVREYLAGWLENTVRISVCVRTYQEHADNLTRYVYPKLGGIRLDQLAPEHIQALYSDLVKKRLSANTIRLVHTPLKQALRQAVEFGTLPKSPAEHVRPPRVVRKEMQALTPEQVGRFLVAAKGDRLFAFYVLLLWTGLRPQEARALKWSDVGGDRLAVRRALTQVSAGRSEPKETKTAAGARSVTLPACALAALDEHRARQSEPSTW